MSPSRSNTIVCPFGETSTEDHVASLVVKAILRASGRGVLMSAAGSGFFAAGFWAIAGEAMARARPRVIASVGWRMRPS